MARRDEKLYACWKNMRERCNNKNSHNYKYYGGKGIKVCESWDDYLQFKSWALLNGYKDGLSIDRIDNSKDYSPDNCRWATLTEQANNKTNNCLITYCGETKTIHQWAGIYNIKANTILMRLKRGWSVERALTEKAFIGKNQTFKRRSRPSR
jgi:hypothetical protein